jgi:transposase
MAICFVNIDRDTPLLLPPDLRDWVPADHLAHFVIDAVEALDLRQVKVNTRGTGDAQYPPTMLLGLLIYSYATGTFGSRRMEQSTFENIAVRLITADTHPDHDTICTFRRENQALLSESFVKVLQLAQELKLAQFGQITVSLDGTKLAANFTDPESRIMKSGGSFQQCYNAQAVVEVESRLIVGERVSQSPNDKQELVPTLAAIAPEAGAVASVLADRGFFSEAAVQQVEQTAAGALTGTVVYAPLDKTSHHRRVADLEKQPEPAAPAPGASVAEVMRHRLKTSAGKALDKLRQQTVEPVFGIIKSATGFRQFLLRGTAKVSTEWTLVCLAYNLRRLHTLAAVLKTA